MKRCAKGKTFSDFIQTLYKLYTNFINSKEVSPILGRMHELKEEFRAIFENSKNWSEGTLELMDWMKKASNVFSKSCQTLINWFGEVTGYFERHISYQ